MPESEGGGASFGFLDNRFSDDVAIDGEHRGVLGILRCDLVHSPGVSDGMVFLFRAAMAVGVVVISLGSHDAPQEGDRFASPDGEKMGGTRVSDGCAWAPKIAV